MHVHGEPLGSPTGRVNRSWRRCMGVPEIAERCKVHIAGHAACRDVAMDGHDLRQGNWNHILPAEGRRESPAPLLRRRGQRNEMSVRNDRAPRCIAVARFPGAVGWVPLVKGDADLDGINAFQPLRNVRGQKVGQTTVKHHRGQNDRTALPGLVVVRRQGLSDRTLLGSDVEVMDAGPQRGLDQRRRGVEKRPCAIDHGCGPVQRLIECIYAPRKHPLHRRHTARLAVSTHGGGGRED